MRCTALVGLVLVATFTVGGACYALGLFHETQTVPKTVLRTPIAPFVHKSASGWTVAGSGQIVRSASFAAAFGARWTTSTTQVLELTLTEVGTKKPTGLEAHEFDRMMRTLCRSNPELTAAPGDGNLEWHRRYVFSTAVVGARFYWPAPAVLVCLFCGIGLNRALQRRRRFTRMVAGRCPACGYSWLPGEPPRNCVECGTVLAGCVSSEVIALRMRVASSVVEGARSPSDVIRQYDVDGAELMRWIDQWYRLRRRATEQEIHDAALAPISKPDPPREA